jgi:chaperonin GroEL (HSP60 family)
VASRCCALLRRWPAEGRKRRPAARHRIVKKAITYPARQIAINAGEDGSVLVGKILRLPDALVRPDDRRDQANDPRLLPTTAAI